MPILCLMNFEPNCRAFSAVAIINVCSTRGHRYDAVHYCEEIYIVTRIRRGTLNH